MKALRVPSLLLLIILFEISCSKDPAFQPDKYDWHTYIDIPNTPYNYAKPPLPAFFNNQFITHQDNTPTHNPITDWGATLGRVLFYDKQLSINHSISCASCHKQEFGFTDTAQFSIGAHGGRTHRHSMSLINTRYYHNGRFFWDERAETLEDQVIQPILDSIEMDMNIPLLLQRLRQSPYYPYLFTQAFGDQQINTDRIAKALAQFVRSIISYRSKYDKALASSSGSQKDFDSFTSEENLGKKIFMNNLAVNCAGCHNTEVYISDAARNNGLQIDNKDPGIYTHTQNEADKGKFKSPTLKSVMLRSRFMHNGSLKGIGAVIDHYDHGILPNPNLDPHLQQLPSLTPVTMNLSSTEKKALIAFLETLTDYELAQDKKFANPFTK